GSRRSGRSGRSCGKIIGGWYHLSLGSHRTRITGVYLRVSPLDYVMVALAFDRRRNARTR
ncbi:hypothetical protein Q604_UNBC05784G0001, partial [human gut metagenome]